MDLDPEGDTILTVSSPGGKERNIRVHSKAVSLASSVIESLLSKDPAKESDSSSNPPRTFNIEGYDFETVLMFVHVCHHRNFKLPESLPPIDMFHLSSLVVECKAHEAVQPVMSMWDIRARQNKDLHSTRYRALLVATALQLDWEKAFRYWTSTMVREDNLDQVWDELRKCVGIPDNLIGFMQGQFRQQRNYAAKGLSKWINSLTKSVESPLHGDSTMKNQLKALQSEISVWMISQSANGLMGISIEKVCQTFSFKLALWQKTCRQDVGAESTSVSSEQLWCPTAEGLNVTISKAQRACIGLCLPCVRTRSDDAWTCTSEHSQRDDESSTGDGDVVIVDA